MNVKTIFTNLVNDKVSVHHDERTVDGAVVGAICLIRNITSDYTSDGPEVFTVTPTMKVFLWKNYHVTVIA